MFEDRPWQILPCLEESSLPNSILDRIYGDKFGRWRKVSKHPWSRTWNLKGDTVQDISPNQNTRVDSRYKRITWWASVVYIYIHIIGLQTHLTTLTTTVSPIEASSKPTWLSVEHHLIKMGSLESAGIEREHYAETSGDHTSHLYIS